MSGAAPLYEEEVRQVRTLLTPKLYVSYGTTEAGVVSYLTPADDDANSARSDCRHFCPICSS